MRPFFCVPVLSLALVSLAAAQTPSPTPPPTQTPPGAPPAQPAPPPRAPEPPRPFPEGAKVAFVNVQRIATESAEGKSATKKLDALREKKTNDLNDKNKALQAAQNKLQQSGGVLSDAARGQLEKEIERIQVDIQRFTQDAQTEVQDLQQELQNDFQRKLIPVIQKVASEKSLYLVFSQSDAGIVWADTGLDITADVIKRFDAVTAAPAVAPKPPAKPPVQ